MSSGGGGPTATDIDRWRQLADAATAAPWKVWSHGRRWVDIENNWDEWLFRAGVGPDFEDDMPPADYAEAVANAEFIVAAREAVPSLLAALVAERERADTAEREVERLRGVNADEGHRVRTLQRLKQVADRAAESAEERAAEAEQSFRNATEVVITLSARVSAAEAALTRIREAWREYDRSNRDRDSLVKLVVTLAVLDTKETNHD